MDGFGEREKLIEVHEISIIVSKIGVSKMQMTATDLAYLKGESSACKGDSSEIALQRAAENNYLVPNGLRDAFVAGFLSVIEEGTWKSPAAQQVEIVNNESGN